MLSIIHEWLKLKLSYYSCNLFALSNPSPAINKCLTDRNVSHTCLSIFLWSLFLASVSQKFEKLCFVCQRLSYFYCLIDDRIISCLVYKWLCCLPLSFDFADNPNNIKLFIFFQLTCEQQKIEQFNCESIYLC